jgi:Protein of unknown function (DUF2877)
VRADSVSAAILPRFAGPILEGRGTGQGYFDFGSFVLAVTRPGMPRMPNGIAVAGVRPPLGCAARIGGGALSIDGAVIGAGPAWNPVPAVAVLPRGGHALRPDVDALAGRGVGLTPAGDDILAGYAAGLCLFHGLREEAAAIAGRAGPLTTRLAATLLDHASRGELPEPAHAYLERGDASALEEFGHSSGRCLRIGLDLAAAGPGGRLAGAELLAGVDALAAKWRSARPAS